VKWLEGITKWDPDLLSRVEYFLGPLEIDWAGGEAFGSIFRPPLLGAPRGQLRAEVKRLVVALAIDIDHQDPRRASDYAVRSLDVDLDIGYATVGHALAARFASPRPLRHGELEYVEYGTFYLALADDASASLSWYADRPEWALPQRMIGGVEHLLEVLFDRLICDTQPRAILAALEPVVANTGCELHAPAGYTTWGEHGLGLTFNPPVELATIVDALRLEDPTASSHDVHMSSWHVETADDAPRVGAWALDITLEGWPRGPEMSQLPERGRAGPSPRVVLTDCVTRVTSIGISPPRR
jgi:hypothetical protein